MASSLDIILVNWNSGHYLRQCLESIVGCDKTRWELHRVVVVDNASTDHSAVGLQDLDLPLTVNGNTVNRGFAAACNQGANGSTADYLLFLNPDTRLFEDTLSRPIQFIEEQSNRSIGICGVRLIEDSGQTTTSCARFPSLRIFFGKMTGLSWLFPKVFPTHIMTPEECQSSREVDQVIGAFFLVRRTVFEELHGFDERFFVYFEEVDFALRALRHGYRSYLLADTTLYHKGCVSSDQAKAQRLFYSLRSRILYGFKNFSLLEAVISVFLLFALEMPVRLVAAVLSFSPTGVRETFSGYFQLFGFCFRNVRRS